jgi:hypothetical protein
MLKITHNIEQIVSGLEAAEQRLANQLIPAVMKPERYARDLESIAGPILASHLGAEAAEEAVSAMLASPLPNGMLFSLTTESEESVDPDDLLDEIEAWVEAEKNLTERDVYKGKTGRSGRSTHAAGTPMPAAVIAARLAAIMQQHPGMRFTSMMDWISEKRPDVFTGDFGKLMAAQMEVLKAWEVFMGLKLEQNALAEVDKAFGLTPA